MSGTALASALSSVPSLSLSALLNLGAIRLFAFCGSSLTLSVSEGEECVSVSAAKEDAAASANADAMIIAIRVCFMDLPQKKFRGPNGGVMRRHIRWAPCHTTKFPVQPQCRRKSDRRGSRPPTRDGAVLLSRAAQ